MTIGQDKHDGQDVQDEQDKMKTCESTTLSQSKTRVNMEYQELTEKIIGCAFKVYNKMGFGFLESLYERCLMIELKNSGLTAKSQQNLTVYYDGEVVGEFTVDVIVEDVVILELKSVRQLVKAHEVQLVNYLTATRKDDGLLINFGEREVEVKRKVRELPEN